MPAEPVTVALIVFTVKDVAVGGIVAINQTSTALLKPPFAQEGVAILPERLELLASTFLPGV